MKRPNLKEVILDYFADDWTSFYTALLSLPEPHNDSVIISSPLRSDDNTPSFQIHLTDDRAGRWHDYGTGEDGDAFDFYGRMRGITEFPKILESMMEEFPISGNSTKGATVKMIRSLADRCIDEKTARAFQIEESPGDNKLTLKITFPVSGQKGELIGYKTHKGPHLKPDKSKAGKGEGVPPQLYPWNSLNHDEVYLVNGEPSVWRAWAAGYRNVLSSTGGEGHFNAEWAELFRDKVVRLLLDRDTSGRIGIDKRGKALTGVAKSVLVAQWPKEWNAKSDAEDWLNQGHRLENLGFNPWEPKKAERKKSAKTNALKTSFYQTPNGHLLEMCYDRTKSPSIYFARWTGTSLDYPERVPLEETSTVVEPHNDRMAEEGVVLLPSCAAEYGSESSLLTDIRSFIHRSVGLSDVYEQLAAFYVLFTWIYDGFNVLPYLRVLGDWGSGKSRFLSVVGSICYKPIFASGATTPSPIFRMLQKYSGTLIFDEADFRYSDSDSEIVKILNCGYMKGFPVLRCEGENHDPKPFRVFGPKLIASRQEWKDKALESRCLTEHMDGKFRGGIPYTLPHTFDDEAQRLRDQLLMFRFRNYGPKEVPTEGIDVSIEPRLNQVMLPLLSLIVEQDQRDAFAKFLRDYNDTLIADRGLSYEAVIVEVIDAMAQDAPDDPPTLLVKDITERVKERLEDMTPQKVSWRLRNRLHIPTTRTRYGAAIALDLDTLTQLKQKFGIAGPDDDDEPIPF